MMSHFVAQDRRGVAETVVALRVEFAVDQRPQQAPQPAAHKDRSVTPEENVLISSQADLGVRCIFTNEYSQ